MGKFTFSPEMTRRCTDVSASKFSKTCKTMNSVSLTYLSKQIIISVDKDMEKSEPSYLADGNVKCAAISENSLAVLSLFFFFHEIKLLSTCISWRGKGQPTPVLMPGKSHGHRSLVGYSPRALKESD